MTGAAPSAAHERPLFIRGASSVLAGILTEPLGGRTAVGFAVFPGTPYATAAQRNGWATKLCRRVAALGVTALRVDWHGVGESAGSLADPPELHHPFVADVHATVESLMQQGLGSIVLGGTCSGGYSAAIAAAQCEDVAGLAALGLPTRLDEGGGAYAARVKHRSRLLSRLGSRRPIATDSVADELGDALTELWRRQVPALFVHCEDDPSTSAFATNDATSAPNWARTELLPGSGFILASLARQDAAIDLTEDWLKTLLVDGRLGNGQPG
jgi:pimeloyl-ACP methyl ester carboxylesterase